MNSRTRPVSIRGSMPYFILSWLVASSLLACQIPVFRYALERWPADRYDLIVLHDGELSPVEQKRLSKFRDWAPDSIRPANCELHVTDIKDVQDANLRRIWAKHGSSGQAVLAALYPENAQNVPDRLAIACKLADPIAETLVESPVRQELSRRLIDGQSAVWLFLPSGNEKDDDAALARLKKSVAVYAKSLELPPQEEIESEEEFLAGSDIDLRLDFSVIAIDPGDKREAALIELLRGSEADLKSLEEPMAFPVFGRGRVLYALIGKGISDEMIGVASTFMVGPCSCQVKEQNPGFDLLMAYDWGSKVGGAELSAPEPSKDAAPVLLTIPKGSAAK